MPGASPPSPERASVSPITSAVKVPSEIVVTVRQTPLIAMESPRNASALTFGPRTVSRAASGSSSRATTSPSSSTIPVNTCVLLRSYLPAQAPGSRRCADAAAGPSPGQAARVLPPIRTLTVGPGVPPGQPADGIGRVADCHRPVGGSPTPEHAVSAEPRCDTGPCARAAGQRGPCSAARGAAPAGYGVQGDCGEQHDGGPD